MREDQNHNCSQPSLSNNFSVCIRYVASMNSNLLPCHVKALNLPFIITEHSFCHGSSQSTYSAMGPHRALTLPPVLPEHSLCHVSSSSTHPGMGPYRALTLPSVLTEHSILNGSLQALCHRSSQRTHSDMGPHRALTLKWLLKSNLPWFLT